MIDQEKIRELAEKWLNGTITDAEKKQFDDWYNEQPEGSLDWTGDEKEEKLQERMFQSVGVGPNHYRWVNKLSIAACVLVLAGIAAVILYTRPGDHVQEGQPNAGVAIDANRGITLTLSDGSIVSLEDAQEGLITRQGKTVLRKHANGQLSYKMDDLGTPENLTNIITVPKGRKIQHIQLSDGTRIWLNVESSIRFPVSFNENERNVEVSGEAYFEVSPDASRKFIVKTGSTVTEVLGTHFNVNSYRGVSITLLEGKVKFSHYGYTHLLTPGQQAGVQAGKKEIYLDRSPDIEAVMAWKHGQFRLTNANVSTIMDQLSRWYDIEVQLGEGLEDIRFSGMIDRKMELLSVLEILSLTREVRFERTGRTVTVYKNTRIANQK